MLKSLISTLLLFLIAYLILMIDFSLGPHVFFVATLFLVSYFSSLDKMVVVFFWLCLFHDTLYFYSLGFSGIVLLPFLICSQLMIQNPPLKIAVYVLYVFVSSLVFLWFQTGKPPDIFQILWYGFWSIFFGSVVHLLLSNVQIKRNLHSQSSLKFQVYH